MENNYYLLILFPSSLFLFICYYSYMNYETLLREHELKVTPQRLGILSIMHHVGHISVEDLFTQIKKQFSSISLATLYKNINAMLESDLISEVKIPHKKSIYEITKEAHIHMVCSQCNTVMDMEVDMQTLLAQIKDRSHHTIENYSVVFTGVCEACQKRV